MTHTGSKRRGFTLVELMVVVAIIGLLAAMAIPDYLSFSTKARQSEAKANLGGIFNAEMAYFAEKGQFTTLFSAIPWSATGTPKYTYDVGSGGVLEGLWPSNCSPVNNWSPGAIMTGFTALAYGNLDADPTCDTWETNNDKIIKCAMDDSRY